MHQCHYCLEYKSIQAFHHSQEDVICQDCYDEQQFEYHVEQAFILQQRKEMKKQLQELDNEELPF
jgi:hypothetical protein